jgi:hypothetical protein
MSMGEVSVSGTARGDPRLVALLKNRPARRYQKQEQTRRQSPGVKNISDDTVSRKLPELYNLSIQSSCNFSGMHIFK